MPKKKKVCPKCSSSHVSEIIYGEPTFSIELSEALEKGEIKLGGCCIATDSPIYYCSDCDYSWGKYAESEKIILAVAFKAYIGGFWGPKINVEADIRVEKLKYSCIDLDDMERSKEFEKELTVEEWQKFIRSLINCDFEYWIDNYDEPNTCDGIQWSVEVCLNSGEKVEKHGSNMYPGKWKQFCNAISKISGASFS